MLAEVQSSSNNRHHYTSTGNSKKLAKTINFNGRRINYTQHRTSDRREAPIADSDDYNEFLIASTTTTNHRDNACCYPSDLRLKFRSIPQTAPHAAKTVSDHAVSATHRGSGSNDGDDGRTTLTKLNKRNCRYDNQQKNFDHQYRIIDQWNPAKPWRRKKSKIRWEHLDLHHVNATAETTSFSSPPTKF